MGKSSRLYTDTYDGNAAAYIYTRIQILQNPRLPLSAFTTLFIFYNRFGAQFLYLCEWQRGHQRQRAQQGISLDGRLMYHTFYASLSLPVHFKARQVKLTLGCRNLYPCVCLGHIVWWFLRTLPMLLNSF